MVIRCAASVLGLYVLLFSRGGLQHYKYKSRHERACFFFKYASNKDADQPAHPCSLIGVFMFRCLDSKMLLVSLYKISSL